MPTYTFECRDCKIEFDTILGINDLHIGECPACAQLTNNRVYTPFTIIDKTPRTLGSLADANKSTMGSYNYSETLQKMCNERKLNKFCGKTREGIIPETVERPESKPTWYRPDMSTPDIKLLKASPEAITRYVQTGKRPIGT